MMDIHTNAGLQWVGKVVTIFLDGNHVFEGATTLHTGGRMQSCRKVNAARWKKQQTHTSTTSAPPFNSSIVMNLDELSNQF